MSSQDTVIQKLDLPILELITLANKTREELVGTKFELCSITNAKSGICEEDCKFCAQASRYSTEIPVYPLKDEEKILKEAEQAKEIGAKRFGIVTSGKGLSYKEVEKIVSIIKAIKENIGIEVCASLGILDEKALTQLKEAGLVRYHHNIETSPSFFPKIISTHSIEKRIKTIALAKEVGLEVCSGGIIGMGESEKDRIEMIQLLKELNVDSVPINILVPIKGTPLENIKPLSVLEILRTVAVARLILEDKTIKIAAGRETILKDYQSTVFLAGANGMIIGGYLTIKGREVEEDLKLVEEIKRLWTG